MALRCVICGDRLDADSGLVLATGGRRLAHCSEVCLEETVEKQLRPRSLAVTGQFLAWVQDGMTDEGRAYLRTTIPAPVTAVLGRIAGRAYHRDIAPVCRRAAAG